MQLNHVLKPFRETVKLRRFLKKKKSVTEKHGITAVGLQACQSWSFNIIPHALDYKELIFERGFGPCTYNTK